MKRKAVIAVATALVLGLLGAASWYTIDQGYRGVILRNGALIGTAEPGLGFKLPLFDTVLSISVQENVRVYGDGPRGFETYSRDQQPAQLRVSVNYQIPPSRVAEVYAKFGSEQALIDRILDPRVYQTVKIVFGQFNAVSAIQDRASLNLKMKESLISFLSDAPLVISGLQVEEIHFSDAYEQSIEQRMQAEVEVQKIQQNAARERVQAEITVIKANAVADSTRADAKAESDAIRMKGEAEASAIRARSEALAQNLNLILLTQAEKWNGVLPSTMLPNGTVPFINVETGNAE